MHLNECNFLFVKVLHLNGVRPDLSSDSVKKMYSTSANLLGMIAITMQDGANTLRLMYELNVLPLALQITSIAGNLEKSVLMKKNHADFSHIF